MESVKCVIKNEKWGQWSKGFRLSAQRISYTTRLKFSQTQATLLRQAASEHPLMPASKSTVCKESQRLLHALVLNAVTGVTMRPFSTTKDRVKMQIGTNDLGHFLLTHLPLVHPPLPHHEWVTPGGLQPLARWSHFTHLRSLQTEPCQRRHGRVPRGRSDTHLPKTFLLALCRPRMDSFLLKTQTSLYTQKYQLAHGLSLLEEPSPRPALCTGTSEPQARRCLGKGLGVSC